MGSFWTRVKGFVSKVVKFVRGKVLPILKPVLPLVQPFLPGVLTPIVSGLQTLEKSPAVKSVIQLQGLTTSPLQGSYQAGEGDYFTITQQVRLCLLDSNDAPIYVDPIANDDSQWQAASDSFKYYLNAAD